MAEVAPQPVTKQMVLDLALEVLDQLTRVNTLTDATLAETRALNQELRAMRKDPRFRALQRGDLVKPC
jgi:hypothetical protein